MSAGCVWYIPFIPNFHLFSMYLDMFSYPGIRSDQRYFWIFSNDHTIFFFILLMWWIMLTYFQISNVHEIYWAVVFPFSNVPVSFWYKEHACFMKWVGKCSFMLFSGRIYIRLVITYFLNVCKNQLKILLWEGFGLFNFFSTKSYSNFLFFCVTSAKLCYSKNLSI